MTEPSTLTQGVQCVSKDTPLVEILAHMKRDGGVIIENLIAEEDIDKTNEEVKHRLAQDVEWDGVFFPKETKRANSMIAVSPTYTQTQLMNPTFQAICAHFLTTRHWFWWGEERKESVSKPYVSSCTAMEIGPGAKAQPLHRDSFVNHTWLPEIEAWDDERDKHRESEIGMMVAGCKVTKENGGTAFIPGSHLWGTDRPQPPKAQDTISVCMEKGDAFIQFASTYHGGGSNTTTDQKRLCYATFMVRGYLRQEENQFLAVPKEVARRYDRPIQEVIGYSLSDPACGYVEQLDPIYALRPELLGEARPRDW
ncbi:phytanoyl-CoA dioxygenase family protein [Aspergillus saccharolyticus JOP 1030-1]|uniref:PhyH-domain-containing protein n=1 Tax=Aspergillus saccharolyticus JOP 1030-1 TaxID=1450539 RepID=A0A318Z5J4_9EURO|nr:hypothetical protein BP01DRAFT_325500 [Aspergillus saccharolyticus JOP 1030-1]PYH42386.1 hypothetical protein BP01DRAFT_325500 [Aspergillus saccharolyticus JOP 1030-1]